MTNQINLPDEVVQALGINQDSELELQVNNQKLTIQVANNRPANQTIILRWFLIPSILATIAFSIYFIINNIEQINFTGSNSIATMVIILGLFSGICTFAFFFIRGKKRNTRYLKDIYWRNFPTIIFSFAITLGIILLGLFWILGVIFEKASFDLFTATILFFLFVAVINYLMILFALSISPTVIITLLISVIVGGVVISMATNSQHLWWQKNFSFLGTEHANYGWQFNLTLVLSALLLSALLDYLFVAIQYKKSDFYWRLWTLRILLNLIAISLGAVGVFPNNGVGRLHALHNHAAMSLVYLIIILIIGIRWLLPNVTKEFLTFSYLIAAIIVASRILFSTVGYLSLTAFELISFFLAFSWILLLIQNLNRLSVDIDPTYYLKLE
ncbi:MAG: AbrB/MazE/SpoVT family DNA-binding domain-containing protein [Streptococcaceae bacterium]|nr:AbrB/MazE/SpoVT family DNA-binding domain-containing protein [Streptococcaceae bacterium]